MFVEDLAAYFTDFAANSCTVGGVNVRAIFDNGYALGDVGMVGISGSQPVLTVRSASVPASPVGLAAVVGGVSYVVAAAEPDGTGLSRLLLERAA